MLYTSEGLTFGLRPNALGLRTGVHHILFAHGVKKIYCGGLFLVLNIHFDQL